MRKGCGKISMILLSAVMSLSALSFTACDSSFTPLNGDYSGEVSSNGGFVVEKGNYYYFINGVDTYTSDNTYGKVVKSALMRISKSDLSEGKNVAQTVIPSLMVAADHTSGIFVYGDRVYYATPNNVKNMQSEIENEYLDFKSAKLDGSDVRDYFRVSDNATVYRYVEKNDTVYLVYAENSDLHSYNTATKTDTLLVKGTESYLLSSSDKTDADIYYTMTVIDGDDKDSPNKLKYTQVYRVSADTTAAPYTFEYNQDYLDEHEGVAPYTNLGTIVLDGIGASSIVTRYTHDLKEGVTPIPTIGYTYSLLSYANDGIYFTRTDLAQAGSTSGETGWLYYLSTDKLTATWNSISGNADSNFDVIAQNTTYASSSAIFYKDGQNKHHYLYVDGAVINRADVGENGVATTQRIARDVSGATLMYTDTTSSTSYDYVYFNRSNGSGVSVERAVFNGTADDYSHLSLNEAYQPVKVMNVQHASDWYNYELLNGYLFYADAESLGSTSYNYAAVVSLLNADGSAMDNAQINALNEKYEEVTGYISDLSSNQATLSTAINSYFYTASTQYFDDNLKEAADAGQKETSLYSEEAQAAFRAYAEGKEGETALSFASYRTRDSFILPIGEMSESDKDAYTEYWHGALQRYVEEETDDSLPVWAWVLIGVGIGLVVLAAVLVPLLVVRSKKRKAAESAPKKKRMEVDITDDRSVDVYATEEKTPAEENADSEESTEELVEGAPEEEGSEEAIEENPEEEAPEAQPAEEEQSPYEE